LTDNILDSLVMDESAKIGSHTWETGTPPSGFTVSVTVIEGKHIARIHTPNSWGTGIDLSFTVFNSDSFYDVSGVQVLPASQLLLSIPEVGFLDEGSTARVTWQTAVPTSGRISYGSTTSYDMQTGYDEPSTSHAHIFSVQPNQTYHFRVDNEGHYGVNTSSADFDFMTPSDPEPVIISNTQVNIKNGTDIEISWKTIPQSVGYVEYGQTPSYGNQTQKEEEYSTDHMHKIEGLEENSTYHFMIIAENEQSILTLSNDSTFATGNRVDPVFNVYPIPLELSNPLHNKRVTFEGIPSGGSLYIFNLLGDLVYKETHIQTDLFYWNAVNNADRRVHTGVYLYLIKSPSGKKFAEGKVVVIY